MLGLICANYVGLIKNIYFKVAYTQMHERLNLCHKISMVSIIGLDFFTANQNNALCLISSYILYNLILFI